MIRRILLSALLWGTAACGPDRPAQSAPGTPQPALRDSPVAAFVLSRPPPPVSKVITDSAAALEGPVAPLPPAPAYLVWTADEARAPVTVWIDGAGREVARRRGVYAAAGARLWRWSQGSRRSAGLDCACLQRNPDGDCRLTRPVGWASVDEVGGPGRVAVMDLPDSSRAASESPPIQRAYPTVGAGAYLFHVVAFAGSACSAHGWEGYTRELMDLRRGEMLPTDTVRYTAGDSAAALDTMVATDWGDPEGVRDPDLRGVEAEWAGDSALLVTLRFVLDAPFAMGDGAGYVRSERIIARRTPRWLAPYVSTPTAVRRYWRTSPRRERAGWSAVDAEHERSLLARFRAAR